MRASYTSVTLVNKVKLQYMENKENSISFSSRVSEVFIYLLNLIKSTKYFQKRAFELAESKAP